LRQRNGQAELAPTAALVEVVPRRAFRACSHTQRFLSRLTAPAHRSFACACSSLSLSTIGTAGATGSPFSDPAPPFLVPLAIEVRVASADASARIGSPNTDDLCELDRLTYQLPARSICRSLNRSQISNPGHGDRVCSRIRCHDHRTFFPSPRRSLPSAPPISSCCLGRALGLPPSCDTVPRPIPIQRHARDPFQQIVLVTPTTRSTGPVGIDRPP
jgi:hypothetical protein